MIRILFCAVFVCQASVSSTSKTVRQFPEDFAFGVTTAAASIEGAWNIDGKGESIWDYVSHTDAKVTNGSNADYSSESYLLFERDVQTIKELGLKHYRFSIAWSRILPQGTGRVNYKGIAYYNRLIDALIKNGIEPWVTMYHWDLPQALQEKGGWVSDKMANWFGNYARILYKNFGDRVKHWITSHEAFIFCSRSYESADYPPLIADPGRGIYECGRNVILANARAYHIYEEEFKKQQRGKVGISLAIRWAVPASESADDVAAAQDYMIFHYDQYMYPIYGKTGNYPQRIIDRIAEASVEEGLTESRLRPFTDKEAAYIKGTSDFLALSHFASTVVYRNASVVGLNSAPSFLNDINVGTYSDPSWPTYGIIKSYPPGFYYVMKYISENYDNTLFYVASNGASSYERGLDDEFRVNYLRHYLNYLLDARADGVNVQGYFYWSLMDKFEWTSGYSTKYGLYETNFESSQKTRTARKSAYVYKEIVRSRVVDSKYVPNMSKPINKV